MKKWLVLLLILILCFISACANKETASVELYEKEFVRESENWEVKLHLKELSEDWNIYETTPYEEIIFKFNYLKEIDEGLDFRYKTIYGNPEKLSIEPGFIMTLTPNQSKYTEIQYQQRLIEEVCFGQVNLIISWEDSEGKSQEESFIFKDDNNPQCENIVLMAPRG